MSGCDAVPSPKPSGLSIVVLGYIVRCPIGGMAWHHLQYVLGLAQMGHEVLFLEDSGDDPWSCYDPRSGENGTDPGYGLEFIRHAFDRVGLAGRWAYNDRFAGCWHGPAATSAESFCADAQLLLNLSGANSLHGYLSDVPARAYLDTDPLFTQIRILEDPDRRRLVDAHNAFFSFGENISSADCSVPDDGFDWQPTRQPVCLQAWPVSPAPTQGAFTTVMQWDSYANREYGGQRYGMKSESFGPYLDLPRQVGVKLEMALGSATAPRTQLKAHGWRLRDPLEVTRDPWSYQDYIRSSRAEFSVAKQGYVVSNSGWFSERSACYLASGRPVVVQDTGFSTILPTGTGLFAFSDPEEAKESLETIDADYRTQCEAARAIAEDYFEAGQVLEHLIDRAFDQPAPARNRQSAGAADG